jgi:lysophospholipase L1-like esterase
MARSVGTTVYNFSKGGMTAERYIRGFADEIGAWERDKAAQAYIIALGVNDLINRKYEIGSFEDIDFNDWRNNNLDTFAGAYTAVIQRYREIEPHARFFLVTMPKDVRDTEEGREQKIRHAELLHSLKDVFPYTYVIDLYKHAPVFNEEFHEKFDGHVGHLNPMGYYVISKMIATYIDYHIRRDYRAFCQIGFIGSAQYDEKFD